MTDDAQDFEALVDALRADLPSDQDRERVRTHLLAAGVAVSAGVATSGAATAAAMGASGAAAGGAKAGLLSQLAGLSLAAKAGIVGAVVTFSVALPIAMTRLHDARVRAPSAQRTSGTHAVVSAKRSRAEHAAVVTTAPHAAVEAAADAIAAAALPVSVPVVSERPRPTGAPLPSASSTGARARSRVTPAAIAREPAATADSQPDATQASPATIQASATSTPSAAPPPNAVPALPAPVATEQAAASPTPSTLRAEAELLDRALSALRAGDRDGARGALAIHAQRYAHGALARERARILQRLDGVHEDEHDEAPPRSAGAVPPKEPLR